MRVTNADSRKPKKNIVLMWTSYRIMLTTTKLEKTDNGDTK